MALRRRSKMGSKQDAYGLRIEYESYTDISVDDIVAFMAISEAERRFVLKFQGVRRDTQTPSDELKSYVMNTER